MLAGIVGLEIAIDELQGKVKHSQNRSAADRDGVMAGLAGRADTDSRAMAGQMRGARDGDTG